METQQNTEVLSHPFERVGLGKAPFRFVGMEKQDLCYGQRILNRADYERTGISITTKPGGTCAYCGQYILNMYNVRSADGRTFHVGSDCVNKTGDKKLSTAVDKARLAHDRARRQAKAVEAKTVLDELLASEAVRECLAGRPHPMSFRSERGETLLDWAEWMAKCSGAKGRNKVLKVVHEAVGG